MQSIVIPWPAAPANNETIVLFATHNRQAGGSGAIYRGMAGARGCNPKDIDACAVTFHRHNKASATSGLRFYTLDDAGAWRESDLEDSAGAATMPVQIAALTPPAQAAHRFVTADLRGFAVEYTAGADNPEDWNGTIKLQIRGGRVVL